VRLLIDNQLPVKLALHLRGLGCDALHVADLGLAQAEDREIWTRAADENRIVVSKDEDFVFLAHRPERSGRLIWVRLGNCRAATLLEAFERALPDLRQAFDSGATIVELR
jgi:predicted nuclease of predicted toxin-antitoxin system